MKNKWLELLAQTQRRRADVVPEHSRTAAQLQILWNRGRAQTICILNREMQAGRVTRTNYHIMVRGALRLIPHYDMGNTLSRFGKRPSSVLGRPKKSA